MANENLKNVMGITMEKIREMIDTDSIVGKPVNVGGITIIPISRVSFGFASGGSDLPVKNPKELFGGGGGAGVSMQPVAFIVITDNDVKLLQMSVNSKPTNQALNMIPDLLDKVGGFVRKDKKKDEEKNEEQSEEKTEE
ncbi:MAG: sporulation protein YtfJ [Oscillospiraceae bacterium]|jgi:sporulation protein YtfJ|nr:sporulation protein YtfJ [Oscillospiraceae bacterium]